MFRVYHSNQLDVLKDILVHLIERDPLANPFDAEQIMVQSPGMAQWLKLELAKSFGIAANIDFPLPASFIWQMFIEVLDDIPQRSAFNKEGMAWKLMALLPEHLDQEGFEALASYLADDDTQLKIYQLSHKIADIFDQYLVYRPEWIRAWEAGEELMAEEQPWQPVLWRALVASTDELGQSHYHRANLYQSFIEKLSQSTTAAPGVPDRLFVFGISALPPKYLEALKALGQHVEVHLFVTNPCRYYWGDIMDPKWLLRLQTRQRTHMAVSEHQVTEQGQTEQFAQPDQAAGLFDEEGLLTVGNPLLASMGKLGRDNLFMLADMEPQEIEAFVDLDNESLLGALQTDLLDLKDRTGSDLSVDTVTRSGHKTLLEPQDKSLQLHACHSPMREVEVLHDQLLAMLEADDSLSPKDIVVMMPDVDAYSPYVQAVFGSASGERYIPYAISDRSAQQESPILVSFLKLLQLPQSRCSASELLELLEVPAILDRFELNNSDLEQLRQWIEETGIRWGLDDQDASRFDLPEMKQNTWFFGLQRMLLGYCYAPDDDASLYDGILPYSEVAGINAESLGKLASFVEQLGLLMPQLTHTRPLEEWLLLVNELLETFYLVDSDGEYLLKLIRDAMHALHQQFEQAAYQHPVTPQVLFDYLNNSLSQHRSSARFLAGQLNFCTLMPMRSIPFKVVCLLGMNDGVYPRAIAPLGFDLMNKDPQRGDRSRRDDDRYLFLEALMSAQQQLYISYIGHSIRDNSERIPSVLVSELLDYVAMSFVLPGHEDNTADESAELLLEHLVCEHPLQPFSQRYFSTIDKPSIDKPSSEPKTLFSYQQQWLDALQATVTERPFLQQPLPPLPALELYSVDGSSDADSGELELTELLRFYRQPCQYFFNRRLKVFFGHDSQSLEDDEPFSLDALENYQLKSDLLTAHLESRDSDDYQSSISASGRIPYGHFGELVVEDQNLKMLELSELVGSYVTDVRDDIEVNIPLAQGRLVGWLKGHYGLGLVRYKPGNIKGRELVRHYIEHLCYCLSVTEPQFTRIIGNKFHMLLEPLTAAEARNQLESLIALYEQGICEPLPLFVQSGWAWLEAASTQVDGRWVLSDDEKTRDKAVKKARDSFEGGFMIMGEVEDPYIQRCYPAMTDEVLTDMTALATQVMMPLRQQLTEVQP